RFRSRPRSNPPKYSLSSTHTFCDPAEPGEALPHCYLRQRCPFCDVAIWTSEGLQPGGIVPLLEQTSQNAADKLASRLAGGGAHQRFGKRFAHALPVGRARHVAAYLRLRVSLFPGLCLRARIGLFLRGDLCRARLQPFEGGFPVDTAIIEALHRTFRDDIGPLLCGCRAEPRNGRAYHGLL